MFFSYMYHVDFYFFRRAYVWDHSTFFLSDRMEELFLNTVGVFLIFSLYFQMLLTSFLVPLCFPVPWTNLMVPA